MATFLELCNLVLPNLNEVLLTQATFGSASGFHNAVKNWVNEAIYDINQSEVEWPFNYNTTTQVLTAETNIYNYPNEVQWLDWQSFNLVRDDSLDVHAQHIDYLTYDEWNIYRRASDENNASGIRIPDAVFQMPNLQFGVTPIPDRAYTLSFDYYGHGSDLVAYNDVTAVPDRFKHVIADRALYYAYMFRDNYEAAVTADEKYQAGLKNMRTILINKYERINDTRVGMRGPGYLRVSKAF